MGARNYTVAVGTAVLVGCAGCWKTARNATSAADSGASSTNVEGRVVSDGDVVVRMAKRGEFTPPPLPPAERGRRVNDLRISCDKHGPTVRAYFKPVVRFARRYLLGKEPGAVHEVFVGKNTGAPRLGDGENIVVDPREQVGELLIVSVGPPFYPPGERWAETSYCLRVLHQGERTTITVEQQGVMIR